ncbi:PilZ domain-containing protein [Methylobacterium sp. 77]|uniref:PilZ domain-containing protein n=1 Tax=Methylobacterium sp. 77 TaxID=1101192 RepID=UPI0012DE7972|nr:PilZ domain-containing protein [Methylobacterium sp. 77]
MSRLQAPLADNASGLLMDRAPRSSTNWIAVIRTKEGVEIPCNVKDVSKSGAKIGVPSSYQLPESFMLKVIGKDFVLQVSLVWRSGNFVGVKIDQVGKLAVRVEADLTQNEATQASHHLIGSRRSRVSKF